MEAPDGQVSFRSQGAKALPAQVLHDSSVPARAYLRRGSLVEELHSWGRVSYPCRTGGNLSPRQRRLKGLQLSCVRKGPLLRLGNTLSEK